MLTLGEQAEKALEIVKNAPIIAFDTETTGLRWQENQPIGYVITESAENNYYIPCRHGGGGNLMDPDCGPMETPTSETKQHAFERELAKAFVIRRERGFTTVGHHTKFDAHFSANQGIMLGRHLEDTSLNEAMLDEFTRSFSLDACAIKHGVTAKKGEPLYIHMAGLFGGEPTKKIMEHYWRLSGDDPVGVDYALGDGISTLELRAAQMKKIEEEELTFIHRLESDLIWTLFRMERRGIKVDEEAIEEVLAQIKERLVDAEAKLPERFNPRSGKQMQELMESHGHTDWPTTAIGNPSFAEKWLKTHDIGRAVLDVRQLTNLCNTFILPLRDRHMYKGRVHTNINQLKGDEFGVIAGRLSENDPNLQQCPKHNKPVGKLFRRLFIPDDGMEIVEGDYSQIEPREYAHYAQEPALLAGYAATPPRDVHRVVADMLNVDRDTVAKRMNMGILTGMQPRTFAMHMGWPLDKATEAHQAWFREFSAIKDFQNKAKAVFKSRGYVKTILGRRCRLDNPQYAYRAASRIIQGGNADIIKYKLLEVDKLLEQYEEYANLLNSIHDSLIWQAVLGEMGEKINKMIVEMCIDLQVEPFNFRVPFTMDIGRGRNWAIATYGEH